MKIVLVTFGSRGDVQPMLALALAIQREGHEVLLAGPPERAEWAEEYGCPYQPLGNDLTAFVDRLPQAHTVSSGFRFVSYIYKEMTINLRSYRKSLKGLIWWLAPPWFWRCQRSQSIWGFLIVISPFVPKYCLRGFILFRQ